MPRSRNGGFTAIWALVVACSGCGLVPRPEGPASVGFAGRGWLSHGRALAGRGPGFVRANPADDVRFGTWALVGLLMRAARGVERALPGGQPLVVGDLSAPFGGDHARHGSHRTGRDADVLFFLVDAAGRPVRSRSSFSFDERGVSQTGAAGSDPGVAYFDTPRNWALVREWVLDRESPVQWIFCAGGIKARLLRYAAEHETSPEALVRASYVLHQPSIGNPHADHFHIRVACTGRELGYGCMDVGPSWPWWRNEHEKELPWPGREDDAALVRDLLGEPGPKS